MRKGPPALAILFTLHFSRLHRFHAVKIFYTDHYVLPLPAGHRFPMAKYWFLRKCVEQARLAGEGVPSEPHAATDEEILRAHDRDYLERVVNGQMSAQELRRIGFPWTPQMVERSRRSAKRRATRTSKCRMASAMPTTSTHWNRASAARLPRRDARL